MTWEQCLAVAREEVAHDIEHLQSEVARWRDAWQKGDRGWAEDRRALREIVNVLEPGICDCTPHDQSCGLRDEWNHALTVARRALGVDS